MNWTGGRLQRSKNANRGIVQKQKAHFARARVPIQNDTAARTSPSRNDLVRIEKGHAISISQPPPSNAHASRHTGDSKSLLRSHDSGVAGDASPVRHRGLGTRNTPQRRYLRGNAPFDTAASGKTNSECVPHFLTDQDRRTLQQCSLLIYFTGRYHQTTESTAVGSPESLMVAKRTRLLQQSDWAGLKRPRHPVMDFKAQQSRDEIGKRRKIRDHYALTIHDGHSRLVPRHVPAETSRQLGHNTGGAHQIRDIRIRIGFEALTNGMSVRTPSQASVMSDAASSESMLRANNALHPFAPKPGQQPVPDAHRFVGGPKRAQSPRRSTRGATPGGQQRGSGPGASLCSGRQGGSPAALYTRSIANLFAERGVSLDGYGEDSNHCITQQLDSTTRPARLIFDAAAELSVAASKNNASPGTLIGESNHGHIDNQDSANATESESSSVQTKAKAGSAEPRLLDEGPWMEFLPTQVNSASRCMFNHTHALNQVHDRLSLLPILASAESGPSLGCATQGAQTTGKLTVCNSPSFPSIPREGEKDELRKQTHVESMTLGRRVKNQRDEDDEFWQRLVFGSDKFDSTDCVPETTSGLGKANIMARKRSPLPVVMLHNSTPFDPLIGPSPRVSDSTQDAASCALLITSSGSMVPMITSPIAPLGGRGQARDSSGEESGNAVLAENSRFGPQSVTHSSMQNNVSHTSDASL